MCLLNINQYVLLEDIFCNLAPDVVVARYYRGHPSNSNTIVEQQYCSGKGSIYLFFLILQLSSQSCSIETSDTLLKFGSIVAVWAFSENFIEIWRSRLCEGSKVLSFKVESNDSFIDVDFPRLSSLLSSGNVLTLQCLLLQ